MRILYLTHIGNFYGANRSLAALLKQMQCNGVGCHVVIPSSGEFSTWLEGQRIDHTILPVPWWASPKPLVKSALQTRSIHRASRGVAALARQLKADLIHTNSAVSPIGFYGSVMAKVPHLWHLREFGEEDWSLNWTYGLPRTAGIIRRSARVVAVSHAIMSHYGLGSPSRRFSVIYNGVGTRAEFRERHKPFQRAERTEFTFALIGHLSENKGQVVAIEALALLKAQVTVPIKLCLIGGGQSEYLDRCKVTAQRLGVENEVVCVGDLSNPLSRLGSSDVALTCSRNEAMGRVTAEAMSCGVPVIAFAGGGTPELIDDHRTGLLYHGGSYELSQCMLKLVNDSALAHQLGESGYNEAFRRFTDEESADRILDLYTGLMEGHGE